LNICIKTGRHRAYRHLGTRRRCGGIVKKGRKFLLDVEIKWKPCFVQRSSRLSGGLANDITERKAPLSNRDNPRCRNWGQKPSVRRLLLPKLRNYQGKSQVICFRWGRLYPRSIFRGGADLVFPTLNIDTDREGSRFKVSRQRQRSGNLAGMARRIIQQGAELILREEPLGDACGL